MGLQNSLTGTPMYMSPEVIKNDRRGRHGAMDIWSLGCVVLEFATGKKPWSNLDNEWFVLVRSFTDHELTLTSRAIMFHIGVATQHPPLPEPGQLSDQGISFIKQCLIIDPMKRPSAGELMDHPWMVGFREALMEYEEFASDANLTSSIIEGIALSSTGLARQSTLPLDKGAKS
jgi:mitogen-activated protein kinase kinase kinase